MATHSVSVYAAIGQKTRIEINLCEGMGCLLTNSSTTGYGCALSNPRTSGMGSTGTEWQLPILRTAGRATTHILPAEVAAAWDGWQTATMFLRAFGPGKRPAPARESAGCVRGRRTAARGRTF